MFAALQGDGVETRAVGGAVRNALLGLPVTEIDLATTAEPERVMALAEEAGLKAVPTGIDHGTVTVIADGLPFEVTTLRRDVETFGRHAKIAYTTSWEEDAKRRDFTLNALYADRDGKVFDPLGGYDDLAAGQRALHRRRRGAHQGRLSCASSASSASTLITARATMDAAGLQGCGEAARRARAALGRAGRRRAAAYSRRASSRVRASRRFTTTACSPACLAACRGLCRFERLVAIEAANGLAPDAA